MYLQSVYPQALVGAQTHNQLCCMQHSALDHLTTLARLAFVPFGLLGLNEPIGLLGLLDYMDYLDLLNSLDPWDLLNSLDPLVIKI